MKPQLISVGKFMVLPKRPQTTHKYTYDQLLDIHVECMKLLRDEIIDFKEFIKLRTMTYSGDDEMVNLAKLLIEEKWKKKEENPPVQ